jgi:GT2 family glycosyltransferase
VASVPSGVQLILAKGDGNWPQNFNKALAQAEGDYIKYLHEDDMLTPNCIRDSVWTLESTGADFIHGNAMEMTQETDRRRLRTPRITDPSLRQMLLKNHIHSATTMYRRTVFDRVGLFNESDEVRGIEEYEFNLRCLKAGLRLRYCNSVLAIYRRHAEQLVKEVKATPEAKAEHSLRRTKIIAQYR